MNRLRIRIGKSIEEFPYEDGVLVDASTVEAMIHRVLFRNHYVGIYTLVSLGEFAYDIYLDDVRVGHAKAFSYKSYKPSSDSPCLWAIVQLTFFAYLALC